MSLFSDQFKIGRAAYDNGTACIVDLEGHGIRNLGKGTYACHKPPHEFQLVLTGGFGPLPVAELP